MKILFLTPRPPYPQSSGGAIVTSNLLERLTQFGSVTLATCLDRGQGTNGEQLAEKLGVQEIYLGNVDNSRSLKNLVRSYIMKVPVSVIRNNSPGLRKIVNRIIDGYNCVFIDHCWMSQYVPADYRGRVILHAHNVESAFWKDYGNLKKYTPLGLMSRIESIRIRGYEQKAGLRADKVLCLSEPDCERYRRLGIPGGKILKVDPIGDLRLVDRPKIEFERTEEALLFVGTLSWEPNSDGINWFVRKCWQLLKQRRSGAKLYIVGGHPGCRLKRLVKGMEGVTLAGYVDDIEEYYTKCRIFICPLRFGSGVKIKLVNSMYRGIPIVATPMAIEGMPVKDMVHVAVASNPEEMVEKIIRLLDNNGDWERLQQMSRSFAIANYSKYRMLSILRQHMAGE